MARQWPAREYVDGQWLNLGLAQGWALTTEALGVRYTLNGRALWRVVDLASGESLGVAELSRDFERKIVGVVTDPKRDRWVMLSYDDVTKRVHEDVLDFEDKPDIQAPPDMGGADMGFGVDFGIDIPTDPLDAVGCDCRIMGTALPRPRPMGLWIAMMGIFIAYRRKKRHG